MNEDLRSLEKQLITDLPECIEFWNEQIATATNKEEFSLVGSMALKELDGRVHELGLQIGEPCVVSGSGIWSETIAATGSENTEGGDTLESTTGGEAEYVVHEEDVVAKEAYFGGFGVYKLKGEDQHRMWYIFQLNEYAHSPDPLRSETRTHYMLIDPATATITPKSLFEEPFGGLSTEDDEILDESETILPSAYDLAESVAREEESRINDLTNISDKFSRMIRSTRFRRLSHARQVKTVDGMISYAEAASDTIEAGVQLCAEYGYITRPGPEGTVEYTIISLSDMLLSGTCLALGMSGRETLTTKAIRNDGDIFNKHDGLCLSIELDEDSVLLEESPLGVNDILHVPLSGQDVAVSFH